MKTLIPLLCCIAAFGCSSKPRQELALLKHDYELKIGLIEQRISQINGERSSATRGIEKANALAMRNKDIIKQQEDLIIKQEEQIKKQQIQLDKAKIYTEKLKKRITFATPLTYPDTSSSPRFRNTREPISLHSNDLSCRHYYSYGNNSPIKVI